MRDWYLRLQTHTQNMSHLLLFHYNNGCTNAPRRYVVRTSAVVFMSANFRFYDEVRQISTCEYGLRFCVFTGMMTDGFWTLLVSCLHVKVTRTGSLCHWPASPTQLRKQAYGQISLTLWGVWMTGSFRFNSLAGISFVRISTQTRQEEWQAFLTFRHQGSYI